MKENIQLKSVSAFIYCYRLNWSKTRFKSNYKSRGFKRSWTHFKASRSS